LVIGFAAWLSGIYIYRLDIYTAIAIVACYYLLYPMMTNVRSKLSLSAISSRPQAAA